MKNRVVTRYYGLQDTIQVSALVLDDAGTASLHDQLKEGVLRLRKGDVEIMRMAVGPDDYNEEKQGFYVFFIHPPVQHNLFVTFDVELFDGRVSTSRTPVSLREDGAYGTASNPVLPARPAKDYTNAWDADGRNRSPI
jgi:hypothetical protein